MFGLEFFRLLFRLSNDALQSVAAKGQPRYLCFHIDSAIALESSCVAPKPGG